MVAGDFNGDGVLDVASTDTTPGAAEVLLGNGDGTFRVGREYATGFVRDVGRLDRAGLVTGDFNNDGSLDLVASDPLSNEVARASVGRRREASTATIILQ